MRPRAAFVTAARSDAGLPGSPAPEAAPRGRSLGIWMCTALVVGNMVGSGIFLLPASLGAYGGVSLLGWLFTTAGAMLLALTFARLARALPRSGGPYAYTREAFGDFPAFLVAWGYWISICAGNGAIAVALVGSLAFFWPALAASPALGAAVALASIWLLVAVNARGVRAAGWVQLVTTVLKLAPLVAIATVGLLFVHLGNFRPFNVSGRGTLSAVSATAALTLWAFTGLESATIPADDVERPDRTIPRATLLGTSVAAAVYILATVAVMGVIPSAALATSPAPFADAASRMWGSWAAGAVAAGAAVACFGALNGWTLLLGQLPLAAARDGLLPPFFGRLSARGTPAPALVVSTAVVTVIVAANYARGLVAEFTFIILLSTLATLVAYAFSSLALLVASVRSRRRPGAARLTGPAAVALCALAYSVWAIVGAGRDAVFWGLVLLLAGVPAYRWGRSRALGGGHGAPA
jgi:APA family basic amino acid/polyamine antiporter